MKKVINITIGKTVFYIEEEAYEKLASYLEAVRNHFKNEGGFDEIMEDIENGMAEKFILITNNKSNSISAKEVEEVIHEMGEIKDFEEFDNKETNTSENEKANPPITKRLYRSGDDVIIAGVASGIASYVGIDPTIIRLLFAISVFFNGFGIFLYIVLWLIVPVATTTLQKFEMRGESVNLSNIKEYVEEKFGPENKNRAENFLKKSFHLIGSIVQPLLKAGSKIIGIFLLVIGIVAVAGLFIAFSSLMFNIDSGYIDFPVREIFDGIGHVVPLLAIFLLVTIPFVFIALAGSAIINILKKISSTVIISLLALWFLAMAVTAVYGVRVAPRIEQEVRVMEARQM
ncbi:MAG TPA: PspC domain-containing protein [Candidatus Paceibacterota bacterium]|nr:PspC domain-containing protein [Candidatus Paceibacterota bacterium]